MKQKLNIIFQKNGEKIVRESFGIPHSLAKLNISIQIPEIMKCRGFIAIYDAKGEMRLQKMLGHGSQELMIGAEPHDNTIGSVMGKIEEGQWILVMGCLYENWEEAFEKDELEVHVEISDGVEQLNRENVIDKAWFSSEDKFSVNENLFSWGKITNKKTAWFKGDFHTHTQLSDGKQTLKSAMERAEEMEMDFYVPTEHNLVHAGWVDTDKLIVPGVEITTEMGHFNLFGLNKKPEKMEDLMTAGSKEEISNHMLEIIAEAQKEDWIVSVNHPFLHIWKWHLDEVALDDVQCLEIVNDPTYTYAKEANDEAISFLDTLWNEGYKIRGVGGSDAHNLKEERYEGATEPSIVGDPGTYVYCKGLSANNLLEAVLAGHMTVTRHCQLIPEIYGDKEVYLPGDEITERNVTYELEIKGVTEYPQVYMIRNTEEGEILKIPVQVIKKSNGSFYIKEQLKMNRGYWKWVRMEVRDQQGSFLGYTNPIYSGQKMPSLKTFGEAKAIWEKIKK